ncbi:hemerythrin domain-containing protein [Streptomyces sp. HNM0574]|uniref:hemerythrin domain-containing protein n=1 Tax=Streptomyces sp. HNM0574 TaxID=2714954 RepID=UPI00146F781E|nr:hemerythrin domain-containing protein [Streptomyces sp. HNM0574]NLU69475.1 hemerythrin domain-containing protein [Streptomyces sp. HNM0574]
MTEQHPRPADSRDMFAVHTMFRREFGALPALIRGVAADDRARARTVAEHVDLVVGLLHVHHRSEDEHCWPKLASRGPEDVAPLVDLMRSQHRTVDAALTETEQRTARWRSTATAADREALAGTVDGLLPPLGEHLAAEEAQLLPLIDRHLTAGEWAEVGSKALGTMPRGSLPVLFGMLLQEATDEERALLREAAGAPVFAVMSRLGPVAARRYRRRVFASG